MSEVFTPIVNEFKIDDFGTVQIPQYSEILSKNENSALDLFSHGLSLKNIAQELYVAPATIRGYIRNVHKKYGVSSNAHATRLAIERGDLSFVLDAEPDRTLTELELKSLEFASLGFTAVAAAEVRNVSANTIRFQQKSVLNKLATHSITRAVRRGFELGYFCYPVKDSD